jgi:S-adenosylmethionine:tRNA ribosyltransferase-isomerase
LFILSKNDGGHNHAFFRDLPRFLRPRSLLVLNDTRVIPARLFARKPTGGRIEVFLVEPVPSSHAVDCERASGPGWHTCWRVLVRGLGRWPVGTALAFEAPIEGQVCERGGRGSATIRFSGTGAGGLLSAIEGHAEIPLPPYIEAARRRLSSPPDVDDRLAYQTVYAQSPGAVAAPTAGLHFTPALLDRIREAGHEIARITLHVGPGTFRPVSSSDPREHRLDGERFEVSESTAATIRRAMGEGRPIVAVGTTVVRTLETLARADRVEATRGTTQLLILPGDRFRVVTDLITNFHLPKSSLLMLVAAFAGRERVMSAYQEAVARGYRFYSYGDAMFIRPGELPT